MAGLTPAKAADIWAEAKREMDQLKARLDGAADVLKEHFRETGKQEYKGIGYAKTSQLRLDTAKVKEHLGAKLPDFQKRVPIESLSLLD